MAESGSEDEEADEQTGKPAAAKAEMPPATKPQTPEEMWDQLAQSAMRDVRADYQAFLASHEKKVDQARKYLLIVSLIGLIVGQTGLVPKEITSLGIRFEQAQQQSFKYLIIAVIAYFMASLVQVQLAGFFRKENAEEAWETLRKRIGWIAATVDVQRSVLWYPKSFKAFEVLMNGIVPYIAGICGILALLQKLPSWFSLS